MLILLSLRTPHMLIEFGFVLRISLLPRGAGALELGGTHRGERALHLFPAVTDLHLSFKI